MENPFDGCGQSDLRLREHCMLIKEQALESWQRWADGNDDDGSNVVPYINAVKPSAEVSDPTA